MVLIQAVALTVISFTIYTLLRILVGYYKTKKTNPTLKKPITTKPFQRKSIMGKIY
ncbi:hypothetical protein [Evansella cellulosilytica]|uniref:Metal homeostatis protein, putative n=1 Tax=Evansella cellulosilytica (strain ATCC 21833 / DSM 2522 / FERM P-1141 / JCM 9156 / N-4) TaxID=649639 RepID=E6TWI7_EVAC2|nr:hypothetical protein [Evansella cellulosilytica]ADU32250.1 metal homeostatis protein, putative [Evansella cellulosilytica DSM 2522]